MNTSPLIYMIVVSWIVIAAGIWYYFTRHVANRPSDFVLPFWIVAIAIALWPITGVTGALWFTAIAISQLWGLLFTKKSQ